MINRIWIIDTLNKLPMVEWDRFVDATSLDGDYSSTSVYGWIARSDGGRDFVLLEFLSWSDKIGFTTSSAKYTREINKILGYAETEHFDCQRVSALGGVNRAIPDGYRSFVETDKERDARRKARADEARKHVSMTPGQAETLKVIQQSWKDSM